MATWTNQVTTSSGGNISLNLAGGYGTVTRNGSTVSFSYGLRMKQSTTTWSKNGFAGFNSGTRYWAKKSTVQSGGTSTWYYANSTSESTTTSETTPWSYSGTVSGTGSGTITITVGAGWNAYTPSNKYSYSFSVPYPAATAYTVSYAGNGGSGVPSSQTKYQGYSLTLSSTTPTRSGYAFSGWYGSDGNSYSAGSTFTGNYNLTLTAQWTPTNPIFTAPTLTETETTISWPAFTINTSSNIYYQVNSTSGTWTSIGSSTTTASAKSISGLSPGTSYTVYFKAVNAADTSATTTHSSSKTTYKYPYITSISSSTIDVGATQTVNLYNPLSRSVTVSVSKVASTSQTFVSTTTTSTSAKLTIPISTVAPLCSNNTTHTATITYKSAYSSQTSETTGTVNLSSSVGAPTIDSSKKTSFVEIGDIGTFTLNGTEYYMDKATGSTSKYLQGKSKLKYKLISSYNPFTAQYGASISSYSVKINSKTATAATIGTQYYEGSSGGVTASGSAVVMTATNTYTLTISATDSRGFTSSFTKTFTTYVYNAPSLGTPQIIRDDGYGTAATLTISGSWSTNMNGIHLAKTIVLYYKLSTASSYSSLTLYSDTGSSTAYKALAGTYSLSSLSFDSDKAYNIYVVATDCFGGADTSDVANLPLGVPLVFIDTAQQGLGVNKFPSGKGLYVDGVVNTTGNIDSSGVITGKIVNNYSGYVTSDTDGLSSYWFKIWDATIKTYQYNDWSCTLQLNNRYDDKWGQIGFGIRQNGANSGGSYNFGICLRRISGNMPLDYMRLYYDNSTGACSLWANAQARYGTVNYQVISKTWRTAKESTPLGTFYSGTYTAAQTLPSSSYVTMTDITSLSAAYPVGAIYMSYNSTSPASLFGGTWERLSGGFIYGCVSSSGTGNSTGTATNSCTLSAAQSGLRSHNHGLGNHTHWSSSTAWGNFYIRHGSTSGTATVAAGDWTSVDTAVGSWWGNGFSTATYGHNIDRVNLGLSFGVTSGGPSADSGSTGNWAASEGHSHNIPYIAVFVWKRTA